MALVSLSTMAQVQLAPRPARLVRAKAAEVVDANGYITAPAEGEEKIFNRSGYYLIPIGFDFSEVQQSGQTRIVYCEDGTVYMHHPLSCTLEKASKTGYPSDTWIKGTRADGYLTFPVQNISYASAFHAPVYIAMGDVVSGRTQTTPCRDESIVFKESNNGKVLTLQNTSSTHLLGAYFGDDNTSLYYWERDLVLSLDTSSDHDAPVELPADAAPAKYILAGADANGNNANFTARLAIVGGDAYLGDFCYGAMGCWIKGTVDAATGDLSFPSEQYLKTVDNYDLHFYALANGSDEVEPQTLVFSYDSSADRYTANADIVVSRDKLTYPLNLSERVSNAYLMQMATVDDIIMDQPAGTLKTYKRYGICSNYNGSGVSFSKQEDYADAYIRIVTAPDGRTVYMEEPILWAYTGAWVKGTVDAAGLVHVPLGQYIQKGEGMTTLVTGALKLTNVGTAANPAYTYEYEPSISEVTFVIDEDGWYEMQPMAADDDLNKTDLGDGSNLELPKYLYGAVEYDDDFYWTGCGDARSIYEPVEGGLPNHDAEPAAGEVVNDYGIITTPGTGEQLTYSRSGKNYRYANGSIESGNQSGVVHVVECDNGTIYMRQPLSAYTNGYAAESWIRGKREGSLIYFAPNQVINYYEIYGAITLNMTMDYDPDGHTFAPDRKSFIVFEEDASGNLTLRGTSGDKPLAAYYEEDDFFANYGDFVTVLTYVGEGFEEQKVEPSWKAERLDYMAIGQDIDEGQKGYNALLAFEGDDVYLGNFCYYANYQHDMNDELVWIKGYRNADGSLTFPKEQYLFTYASQGKEWKMFFYGATDNDGLLSLSDLTFIYDAKADRYTALQNILISWGRIGTTWGKAEYLTDVRLEAVEDPGRPYVITERPEGVLCTYNRSGFSFGIDYGVVYTDQQSGTIDIVFSEEGRYVYMHNPISKVGYDSWVSGIITEDNKLLFPTMQWLDYSDEYGYGVQTGVLVLVEQGNQRTYSLVPNIANVTFTYDEEHEIISLDRFEGIDYDSASSPRLIYGAFWSNDYIWTGCGDFDSVYSIRPIGEGISNVETSPLAGTYYDFAGRRLRTAPEGLHIDSGRKVIR